MSTLRLLCVDPGGLGGIWIRARPSPARDRFMAALPALPLPMRRLHPNVDDTALYGGLDLAATLAAGRPARSEGILAHPSLLVLSMAERATPGLAARLARALDAGQGHVLVAIDEGAEADEGLAPALADRLAFRVDLSTLAMADAPSEAMRVGPSDEARARLAVQPVDAGPSRALVSAAIRLGVDGLRAPALALAAARASAASAGRSHVEDADLELAASLVLAPRATHLPEPEPAEDPDEPDTDDPSPEEDRGERDTSEDPTPTDIPAELLLEAVRAALPAGLLDTLPVRSAGRVASGSGSGGRRRGNRRGRPLPSRPGSPGSHGRLDLVATLRAAAPWQTIRRKAARGPARPVWLRPEDFRLRRFEDRSDRLVIFAVDASGSAAMARLGEAKGAVELLLAQAYARRDHVALIGFRGDRADVLLPPTRSLVQTKRRLAALPGGGGTPLAAGLRAGLDLALVARGHGLTPALCLLTDGRANVALDGAPDRKAAQADASAMAAALAARGIGSLVIDMGRRPHPALADLASVLSAPYVPLPRADAQAVADQVSASLGP